MMPESADPDSDDPGGFVVLVVVVVVAVVVVVVADVVTAVVVVVSGSILLSADRFSSVVGSSLEFEFGGKNCGPPVMGTFSSSFMRILTPWTWDSFPSDSAT